MPRKAKVAKVHDLQDGEMREVAIGKECRVEFAPGSTWVVFTDRVLHAALSGQFVLEQTFDLPIEAMREPQHAPLRILERLTHRQLV